MSNTRVWKKFLGQLAPPVGVFVYVTATLELGKYADTFHERGFFTVVSVLIILPCILMCLKSPAVFLFYNCQLTLFQTYFLLG